MFFEDFGFNITKEQADIFEKYYETLITYNENVNLTAVTDKKEVYIKHFIDSLFGAKYINGDFLDIGSGGGFPAIPLKIYLPDLKVTLLEATDKKCVFLRKLVEDLKLNSVEVINGRAEELSKNAKYREKFACVTARAVAALPSLCEYCLPFVKTGGRFIAYKANAENEITAADSAINILGGKIESAENFDLYGNSRTLIVIKKERATEKKYPRSNAQIRKNPL